MHIVGVWLVLITLVYCLRVVELLLRLCLVWCLFVVGFVG